MNEQPNYSKKGPVRVTKTQTVIHINDDLFVIMGRVCKSLELSDSVGMGIIRKDPERFGRRKERININGRSPQGSPVVVIPLKKVADWIISICPVFVGDSVFGDQVRKYQRERQAGRNPEWPANLKQQLITAKGTFTPFPESLGALNEPESIVSQGLPLQVRQRSADSGCNSKATMSSREIAELAGKQHKHVMADIRTMCEQIGISSAEFSAQYQDSTGRTLPCFELDRYHTEVLITGYDVKRRAAVIKRWHDLESGKEKPVATKQASRAELILQQAQALVEHERRLDELEREQEDQRRKMYETESQLRAITEGEEYFTVSAYCNIKGIKADSAEAGRIGKRASYFCRSKDWHMGSAKHPRFGTVKTYPSEALELALSSLGGAA